MTYRSNPSGFIKIEWGRISKYLLEVLPMILANHWGSILLERWQTSWITQTVLNYEIDYKGMQKTALFVTNRKEIHSNFSAILFFSIIKIRREMYSQTWLAAVYPRNQRNNFPFITSVFIGSSIEPIAHVVIPSKLRHNEAVWKTCVIFVKHGRIRQRTMVK